MPHPETLLAQAGGEPDHETGAVVPPIHLSTTFERAPDGSFPSGYKYSRGGNPTRHRLEKVLAELEGGATCAVFSSGMAATQAVIQSLEAGAHILLPDDVYYGVRSLLEEIFERWDLSFTPVDMTDLDALQAALRPETQLVWAETPSNPLLKITDLEAVAAVAHEAGARLVVDGTWTTPLLQRPLALSADLVVHSATKYLSGHSDVIGGAVIAKEADTFFERVRAAQEVGGAILDPFSAWLALRGLRTLGVRIERQCNTARRVAAFLVKHPKVDRVHYPSLETHPGHEVARRQMEAPGGMCSFEVKGSVEDAMAVAAHCEVFTRATSLGGTESLIEHRASTEPPFSTTPETLLRLSIGLEHPDDLTADLAQAFEA